MSTFCLFSDQFRSGCRAGDSCPFIHDPSQIQNNGPNPKTHPKAAQQTVGDEKQQQPSEQSTLPTEKPSVTPVEARRFLPPPVEESRIVSKPVPKAQSADPRTFQIGQLRRRFSPTETAEDEGTALAFQLLPSDPDFPFEMPRGLVCVLHVPKSFPNGGRPSLEVRNDEMGREYQVSVEKGFARLVEKSPRATLLGLMNSLDRQLEGLLGGEQEVEVTIIPNINPNKTAPRASRVELVQDTRQQQSEIPQSRKPPNPYTSAQLHQARERREVDTRQLEARLGRTPLFSRSSDGIAYTLPISPRKHDDLPVPLQAFKSIKLLVPQLYPLQNCEMEIQGVSREAAKATEAGFKRKVKEHEEMTLMGHVNYLAQNMHLLATEVVEEPAPEKEDTKDFPPVEVGESAVEGKIVPVMEDEDRGHIKIIPRPPEWGTRNDDEDSSESDYSDSYDSGDEDGEAEGGAPLETVSENTPSTAPERGISLSFPSLELYSIELLELTSLCITIKCERCKDTTDINNLQDKSQKTESCKKCAVPLSVGYRRELMHVNSFRAGYLDLDGCTVVDMLPSNFLPTCSECSTTHPAPGVVSVRGSSTMAICRECHRKLTFKIPEVKFLLISASTRASNRAPVRKTPKESLGIVAGQELPRQGRCSHYAKSYRWFRFSCCAKVFACDRCHDEGSDHPNEHANRMICGFCSREQNYRPDDCGVCRASLVKKAGSGFWEGGKGTRDKARMSRKGMSPPSLLSEIVVLIDDSSYADLVGADFEFL